MTDQLTITEQDFRDITARALRFALEPQIAALRPGDEIEVTFANRRTWARVTGSWQVARGRFVRGRTTFGLIVTTHEEHISEVRREENEAIRESWARRFG